MKDEGKQHERIVQRLVNNLIKEGCPPELISISGIQNPGLEAWARRKGIVFDKKQKVDIIHPDGYSMEEPPEVLKEAEKILRKKRE